MATFFGQERATLSKGRGPTLGRPGLGSASGMARPWMLRWIRDRWIARVGCGGEGHRGRCDHPVVAGSGRCGAGAAVASGPLRLRLPPDRADQRPLRHRRSRRLSASGPLQLARQRGDADVLRRAHRPPERRANEDDRDAPPGAADAVRRARRSRQPARLGQSQGQPPRRHPLAERPQPRQVQPGCV